MVERQAAEKRCRSRVKMNTVGVQCALITCTSWRVARECCTRASPMGDVRDAIAREKQLKGWVRSRKTRLIEQKNPTWEDLADTLFAARRTTCGAQEAADPSRLRRSG